MITLAVLLLAGAANTAGSLGEVRRLYADNRFGEAETILTKILRAEPRNADARLWLAYIHLAAGDLESALQTFEQLGDRFNSDPEYLFALSETCTRRSRELSEKIAALGEPSARAHQLLAYRYNARGEWQIAVRELRRASELRPQVAGVHLEAAEILWEQKQYADAAEELERELVVSPSDFFANLRYGQWLLRSHQSGKAVAPLETAARYFRYPEAHALLAFAWRESGEADRALGVLNSGLTAFPQNRDLANSRTQLLAASPAVKDSAVMWRATPLREPAKDKVSLRARLARNPGDEDAMFLLSRLYADDGDASFRALEQVAPDSYRVWQIRGLQAESAGDLTAAEKCYRKVLAMQPRLAGVHFALGLMLQKLGNADAALEEYKAELKIDPRHYLASFELGASLARVGSPAAAIPWLEKATELRPSFVEGKVELGKAYLDTDNTAAAIPVLQSVVALSPDHTNAHYLLYRCYKATGATTAAQQELMRHQQLMRASQQIQGRDKGVR